MGEIKDQSVDQFLHAMASKAATPGGGSAAAVLGAMSAALTSMVCNLTVGKAQYAEVEEEMQTLLHESEQLRIKLTELIKADVDVFNRVMACYGLPKATQQEKESRSRELQAVLKEATDVPLACARACAQLIRLSRVAAEKGNRNVVSDAGVAVMSGYAALKSSALNVYINLGGISDKAFTDSRLTEIESLVENAEAETAEIYKLVKQKL